MINSMVIAQCLYYIIYIIIMKEQLQVDLYAHIWHKQTTLCKVSDKWRVWYTDIRIKHDNDITIDETPKKKKKRPTTIQLGSTPTTRYDNNL